MIKGDNQYRLGFIFLSFVFGDYYKAVMPFTRFGKQAIGCNGAKAPVQWFSGRLVPHGLLSAAEPRRCGAI